MERTDIYLIRHGAIDNPDDIAFGRMPLPLSDKGIRQVEGIAEMLQVRGVRIEKIYTSPLKRAVETSEILCKRLGIDTLEVAEELNDVDVGELQGAPQQILRDVDYSEEKLKELGYEIESKSVIVDRTQRFLAKVLESDVGKTVGFVSHGDITRLIIWFLTNPEKTPPKVLRDSDYLATAEAVVLKFERADFIGKEFVRRKGEDGDYINRTESS